jgi:non-ribosomal peptide synthetase component E (peptide arylation enzyme)
MMVPERIEVVEEFPRTPLGKIDRAAVKEAYCR